MFCRRPFRGYAPIDEVLIRKGFQVASCCMIYKCATESFNRVFMECPCAQALWEFVSTMFSLNVMTS